MRNLKQGFTLIELLVVIAIIGILATTLAPKLREQLAKAKDSKAIALLGATRTAAGLAFTDEMVTATGPVTIDFEKIAAKLDNKAVELLNGGIAPESGDLTATVAIGGSRTSATGKLTYGGTVTMTVTSDGEVNITGTTPSTGIFSAEGKEWTKY